MPLTIFSLSSCYDKVGTSVRRKEQKDILDSNADTIKTYEEDIKGFKEEYITKTSEVKKLIAEAKNALNYKNAEGLSAAFSTQLSDAKGKLLFG